MSVARSLRAHAAPAAKTALLRLGGFAACRALLPSRKVAILRYHAVCGPEGHRYANPGICITPSAFERQIRYLADHYAVLPLPEVIARLRTGGALPSNTAVITFDDGYEDNLGAARTLHSHGLTGTFYLTAGCLDGGQPFWPAEIRALLAAVPGPRVELAAGGRREAIDVHDEPARRRAVGTVTKLFKSVTIPAREALRDQLRSLAGPGAVQPRCMLGWEQVVEMHRLGMTIGSHTLTHPNLPSAGVVDARAELAASKARLEGAIGAPVTMFAYPNGGADRYMTPEIAGVVREVGYEAAVTSRNAFASRASDLFALERIQVQERLEDLVFALEIERFGFKPAPRRGEVQ